MNWEALGAVSTAVQAIVILITGPLIYKQFVELKRATMATSLANAFAYLQGGKVREGRKIIREFSKKNIDDWTPYEKTYIELACNAFDMTGIMCSNGIIPAKLITREYRDNIIACWENAQPLIQWNRQHRRLDYWDDFEKLYVIAKES